MSEVKVIDRESEIIFHNWTSEDFEGQWSKRVYRLQANKSYYLPYYLAEHFAKHLVDRELNKMAAAAVAERKQADPRLDSKEQEKIESSFFSNFVLRQELMDKCVTIPKDAQVGFVSPKEVPMREVKLRTQERTESYVKKGDVSPGDAAQRRPVTDGTPAEEGFQA